MKHNVAIQSLLINRDMLLSNVDKMFVSFLSQRYQLKIYKKDHDKNDLLSTVCGGTST